MAKTSSASDVKLASNYDGRLCKTLQQKEFHDRLDRPLAFWALPNDRRLPTALLGADARATCSSIHSTNSLPRQALARKKLEMLIKLLVRATKEDAADAKLENLPGADESPADGIDAKGRFDPGACPRWSG